MLSMTEASSYVVANPQSTRCCGSSISNRNSLDSEGLGQISSCSASWQHDFAICVLSFSLHWSSKWCFLVGCLGCVILHYVFLYFLAIHFWHGYHFFVFVFCHDSPITSPARCSTAFTTWKKTCKRKSKQQTFVGWELKLLKSPEIKGC